MLLSNGAHKAMPLTSGSGIFVRVKKYNAKEITPRKALPKCKFIFLVAKFLKPFLKANGNKKTKAKKL